MMDKIAFEKHYTALNYAPLPVVIQKAEGVYMWDEKGKKYLDFMSAYSAVSMGHGHPKLLKVLQEQCATLVITSRAFYNDKLGAFAKKLCDVTGLDKVLPMNTGVEAVETAVKAARRWGVDVKGIAEGKQEIVVSRGNFHGRTTTVVGFSSDAEYRRGFAPFDGGFREIPFGDADALEKAITPNTCAFLTEPMQGESGIIMPPKGWLKKVREICDKYNILFILDEIQTGMGRTGKNFAYMHEDILPDGLCVGKAIGGGLFPVSAFVAKTDVMNVFDPGSHGSTWGGNPLASAIGLASLEVLEEEKLAEQSAEKGLYLMDKLKEISSDAIADIRGAGLWVGVDLDPEKVSAHDVCVRMMNRGVLSKETHETVVRFAPPLTIAKEQIDFAVEQFKSALSESSQVRALSAKRNI